MNPTQDFKTAYGRLTPQEQANYSKFNPNVNTQTGQSITGASLSPETPLKVSPAPNYNVAMGIIEETTSQNIAVQKQTADELARQQEISKLEVEQKTGATGIQSLMEKLGMRGSEKVAAEQSAGIPKLQQEATEITNQIEAKQLAVRRQVEDLDKTFQGTLAGKNDAINAINKNGARELADLSIIQNARNRNLLTAQSIVDRKIDLETEDLKVKLEGLKFFYEENKENLTKEEQRQFETATKKADREYTEAREKVKTLENTKLSLLKSASEQGAPNSVLMAIQNAQDPEDAITAAGEYGGDIRARLIQDATLKKLGVELQKAQLDLIANDVNKISPYQQERGIRILQSVDELKSRATGQTVGLLSLGKFVPGSVQRNFKTDLDSLKANIAFGELTAMREASKTGGALGQVSNIELNLLESALAGLDQGQSPANFRKNLEKIKASIERWQKVASKVSEEDQLKAAGYTDEQIQQIKQAK